MIDQYGRTIEYLRISVTDRCNLRCVYCMPEEGIEQLPHEQILTFDEIERVCRISTRQCLWRNLSNIASLCLHTKMQLKNKKTACKTNGTVLL